MIKAIYFNKNINLSKNVSIIIILFRDRLNVQYINDSDSAYNIIIRRIISKVNNCTYSICSIVHIHNTYVCANIVVKQQ